MIPINSLSTEWYRLMQRLKLNYRLHDLRHSYACRLAVAGVNPAAAQKVMGHKKIETTMLYYRLTEDDVIRQTKMVSECQPSATPPENYVKN